MSSERKGVIVRNALEEQRRINQRIQELQSGEQAPTYMKAQGYGSLDPRMLQPKPQLPKQTGTYSPLQRQDMMRRGTWLPYMDYLQPATFQPQTTSEGIGRLQDQLRTYRFWNIEQAKQRAREASAQKRIQGNMLNQYFTAARNESRVPTYEQYLERTGARTQLVPESMEQYYTPSVGQGIRGVMATMDIGGLQSDYEKLRSELMTIDSMNNPDRYREVYGKLQNIQNQIADNMRRVSETARRGLQEQQQFAEAKNRIAMRDPGWEQRRQQLTAQNRLYNQRNMQSAAARGFYQTPFAYQNL